MRIRILPYAMRSQGARRLSEALQEKGIDCLRVHPDGAYKPRIGDLIVLWGHGGVPEWWRDTKGIRVLNHPDSISIAINKIEAFKAMEGKCNIPPWTINARTAYQWAAHTGVLARTQTEGMDGSGIICLMPGWSNSYEDDDAFPEAPLYTQFIPSEAEFRVHVFGERVIVAQKKGSPPDSNVPISNEYIRTERNGWAFLKTSSADIPEEVYEQAVRAVNALRLDFGGVDVLWDGEKAWVLEVNTAPAIVGTDVEAYAQSLGAMAMVG